MDILSLAKNKTCIGYGTGITMLGTLASCSLQFYCLVDDNPELQGKSIDGMVIKSLEWLREQDRTKYLVIICGSTSSSVLKMWDNLREMDYEYGVDFTDCYQFHFYSISQKLKNSVGIDTGFDLFEKIQKLSLQSTIANLSTISGTWLFVELCNHLLSKIGGNIAECGVYFGGNAWVSLQVSQQVRQATYLLLDSFEGFKEISTYDPMSRKDDFKQNDYQLVKDTFSPFNNVAIHRGYFDQVLPELSEMEYALVYIDCDLYQPTIECNDYFFPRLKSKGMLLIHDYWEPGVERPTGSKENFAGIKKAVDILSQKYTFDLIEFPETTHALLIKK